MYITYAYPQIGTQPEPVQQRIQWFIPKLIQLSKFELELDFTEHNTVQCVDCGSTLGPLYTIHRVTS